MQKSNYKMWNVTKAQAKLGFNVKEKKKQKSEKF